MLEMDMVVKIKQFLVVINLLPLKMRTNARNGYGG